MALYVKKKIDLLLHGTSMRVDRLTETEFTTDLLTFPYAHEIILKMMRRNTFNFTFISEHQ